LFDFNLLTEATVTLQSLGSSGGTNSASILIPAGGFDTYFAWFFSDGGQIGTDSSAPDAFSQVTLPTGSYILALTQNGNTSNGDLSDGFAQQGTGNFTASGSCTAFCDPYNENPLTGNWAVDILNVSSASDISSAPEPVSATLAALGIALLAFFRRRRLTLIANRAVTL